MSRRAARDRHAPTTHASTTTPAAAEQHDEAFNADAIWQRDAARQSASSLADAPHDERVDQRTRAHNGGIEAMSSSIRLSARRIDDAATAIVEQIGIDPGEAGRERNIEEMVRIYDTVKDEPRRIADELTMSGITGDELVPALQLLGDATFRLYVAAGRANNYGVDPRLLPPMRPRLDFVALATRFGMVVEGSEAPLRAPPQQATQSALLGEALGDHLAAGYANVRAIRMSLTAEQPAEVGRLAKAAITHLREALHVARDAATNPALAKSLKAHRPALAKLSREIDQLAREAPDRPELVSLVIPDNSPIPGLHHALGGS